MVCLREIHNITTDSNFEFGTLQCVVLVTKHTMLRSFTTGSGGEMGTSTSEESNSTLTMRSMCTLDTDDITISKWQRISFAGKICFHLLLLPSKMLAHETFRKTRPCFLYHLSFVNIHQRCRAMRFRGCAVIDSFCHNIPKAVWLSMHLQHCIGLRRLLGRVGACCSITELLGIDCTENEKHHQHSLFRLHLHARRH
jgi:hypothetical protein